MTLRTLALAALPLLAVAAPLAAQVGAPTGTSQPTMTPIVDTIPAAVDAPYAGTLKLAVDATDLVHGIFRVKETVPVKAGPLVLLYPKWLPGNHSPSGTIQKLAGLTITAGGRTIPWRRDPVDVFAFHLDVPAGISSIDVSFQYLSARTAAQGGIFMSPDLVELQWTSNALYPAGYYTRRIMIEPSVKVPDGFRAFSALRSTGDTTRGGTIRYQAVAFDTLMDSPLMAGRYARTETLGPGVALNMLADAPDELAIKPEQLAIHRAIYDQATRLFGAQHYDHYDFLFWMSDKIGGQGLEHHRSSEDGVGLGYFKDWENKAADRDLLTHEYTHSWDGKFRRGADLWTPDFRTPMQNSLLWVYEGQTQFWGKVLAARAGLLTREEAFDALAATAANYEYLPGREWRPLVDTTNDPIIAKRAPQTYPTYQRSEDYYEEGQLIWLEVDNILRTRSGGRKSLDDFARAFFGVRDRDWGELTYTFDDVIATLNQVMPYDWSAFLHARVDDVRPHAPLAGITAGGYKLVFTDKPGAFWSSGEKKRKYLNLRYSGGLIVGKDGVVSGVVYDGPAFDADIVAGTTIVAVNGKAYSDTVMKDAISAAKGGSRPIALVIRNGDVVGPVDFKWNGGLRYPHLERTGTGASTLDALYAPKPASRG